MVAIALAKMVRKGGEPLKAGVATSTTFLYQVRIFESGTCIGIWRLFWERSDEQK